MRTEVSLRASPLARRKDLGAEACNSVEELPRCNTFNTANVSNRGDDGVRALAGRKRPSLEGRVIPLFSRISNAPRKLSNQIGATKSLAESERVVTPRNDPGKSGRIEAFEDGRAHRLAAQFAAYVPGAMAGIERGGDGGLDRAC